MSATAFAPTELDALHKILQRVATHAPPAGVAFERLYDNWPNQAGRAYMDAVYRPRPIGMLLSDDIILHRQWFLLSVPHVVSESDAEGLLRRALGVAPYRDSYVAGNERGYFGVSRRDPPRLARFVQERLLPLLGQAPITCTADLLLAAAAVQEAKREGGGWVPPYTMADQRHSIEVELVLLAESSGTFLWSRDEAGRLMFSSGDLAPSAETVTLRKQLAEAEQRILALATENQRLAALTAASSGDRLAEAGLPDRLKRVYRKYVVAYHPDKLAGRPDVERRVADEVVRVLNALYDELKVTGSP